MDEKANNINNSSQKILKHKIKNYDNLSKINHFEGYILGNKDSQILELENYYKLYKSSYHNLSLEEILHKKDIIFSKEYFTLNNLYTSSICFVKFFRDYERGRLIINDKHIIVELNKKLIKLKEASCSDISESKIKNKSTQKDLPNYIVNDTIDKIITGKNIEKKRKEMPKYILDINLDLVTCKFIMHKEKQKFRLLLLGYNKKSSDINIDYLKNIKVIKFNCVNVEKNDFYHLCNVLNKSIILSEGYQSNKFGINFYKNYFTKSSINVINFIKEANTGDIILFKNMSKSSRFIRTFMNSEYDHVSLVLKNNENKIVKLYDCIKSENIRLRDFSESLSLYINIDTEKIVTRKLNISIEDMEKYIHNFNLNKYENIDKYYLDNMSINEIKNKFYQIINEKFNNFVIMNSKAKFEFSICKYLCSSKRIKNETDLTKKNSYFCSELIAAMYMYSNIMNKKYDPSCYLPKDFSEKGKIEFINGFYFGKETIIDFSY